MRAAGLAIALVLALAPAAAAQDAERMAMAQVRFSTETSAARECAHIGSAKDNSLRDLRRKIVRAGGNMAVLSFRVDDLSTMFAEVFRCGGSPAATAPPPVVSPPPPPPPPPPPAPAQSPPTR